MTHHPAEMVGGPADGAVMTVGGDDGLPVYKVAIPTVAGCVCCAVGYPPHPVTNLYRRDGYVEARHCWRYIYQGSQ